MIRANRLVAVALVSAALTAGAAVPASAAVICNRYCDGRNASLSPVDRQPLAAATVWGRRIILHLNDTDAMGWASIDGGDPTDRVWLDRSFDGGRTWAAN